MDNELGAATLLTHCANEMLNIFPLVKVINSQATLDSHGNGYLRSHLCHDLGNKLRVFHQDGSESALDDFVRGTSAVDVYFIVAKLLAHLGCLPHRDWVTTAQLAYNGVLVV